MPNLLINTTDVKNVSVKKNLLATMSQTL